jgi:DNA repair protein RecO (recombination protein O)
MLHHSIHEEERKRITFLPFETALHWLDNHDEIANFHLILLLETTKYGFYPDTSDVDMPFSK